VKKILRRTLVVLAVLIVLAEGAALVVIGPKDLIGMLRYDQRQEGTLKTGELAPDVTLVSLDGAAPVSLSSKIGPRPLVLVFGSFT